MRKNRRERIFRGVARNFWIVCIFTFCLLFMSASCIRADGEIIILPGEKYPIPCLTHMAGGQEYDIAIENPDIVGLDETGKCIVGVAVGTTEVTVRLVNPDSAYTYVFAVAETYALPYEDAYGRAEEQYDYGPQVGNEFYTGEAAENVWYDESDAAEAEIFDGDSTVAPAGTGEENGEASGDDAAEASSAALVPSVPVDVDQDTENESISDMTGGTGPESDSSAEGPEETCDSREETVSVTNAVSEPGEKDTGEETDGTSYADLFMRYPPVTFSHGNGMHDILVPDHYTVWICVHSAGPVTVLYAGAGGMPLPYRTDGNMIYIDSSDIPEGNSLIQILTVDAAGRVGAMSGYGVAK